MTVYLAAPLFSSAHRVWNRMLAEKLKAAGFEVLLPQDTKHHHKYNEKEAFGHIFRDCVQGIDKAAAVVAILDGEDSDSGTAWEVGYAYGKKPIVGVRTDYRGNQERGMNLMLSRSCDSVVYRPAFDEDLDALATDIVRKLRKLEKAKT